MVSYYFLPLPPNLVTCYFSRKLHVYTEGPGVYGPTAILLSHHKEIYTVKKKKERKKYILFKPGCRKHKYLKLPNKVTLKFHPK